MQTKIFAGRVLVVTALLCPLSSTLGTLSLQPSLASFKSRMPTVSAGLSEITRSAEAAALRTLEHPSSLLNIPFEPQTSFSREFTGRAGGLVRSMPPGTHEQPTTENDIVLFNVRSWDKNGIQAKKYLKEYKNKGWMTVLFASQVGRPYDLDVDFFIDNGATSEAEKESAVNALVNVTNGWIWCCEYFAAMTRQGKYPPVLLSGVCNDGRNFNKELKKDGLLTIKECATPISAGELGKTYIEQITRLISDLSSHERQNQIARAVDIITERLKSGKKVAVSAVGHFLGTDKGESFRNIRSPWLSLEGKRGTFEKKLAAGDLLILISYMGMTMYDGFPEEIARVDADVITCYVPHIEANPAIPGWGYEAKPDWLKLYPDSVAHIDQCWFLGDAEVAIPVPPGAMAPISGLNAGLIFRMLDDAVFERLGPSRSILLQ